MLSIPNQLEAAYIGQDVTLECHTEAYPTSINYWTTERGDMIVSGNFNFNIVIIYICLNCGNLLNRKVFILLNKLKKETFIHVDVNRNMLDTISKIN